MRIRFALSPVLASGLAMLAQSARSDTTPIDIRIAHVGGTTGAYAHIGKDNRLGVRMALDERNRRRPSIGGRPGRFVLESEDDVAEPRQAAMAGHAAALGLKRVAVLDDRSAHGQGVAEMFERVSMQRGLRIVARHFTQDKAMDFSSVLTDITSDGARAIFFGGMDAQAGPMLRQTEHMGLHRTRLMGGDGLCTRQMKDLSSSAAPLANVRCAGGGVGLEKMDGVQAWKQRCDARFPGRFQVCSPYSHDATMIVVNTKVRAQSADPRRYLPVLARTDHNGVTGRIGFDANGDLQRPPVTIFRFVNGDKHPVATQH